MQQKIFIGLVLTLVIAIFIPLYWATESSRQETAQERIKAEVVERGAELYTSHCTLCHGPAGEGRIGPALKGSPLDENVLEKVIARGIPGTAMPASAEEEGGSLKKHQIKDLVTFIKNWDQSLLKGTATPPAAPAPTASPSPTQTPNPVSEPTPSPPPAPAISSINASELFASKCSSCHGKNREGISEFGGPPLNPQSLTDVSDDEVRKVILDGRLTGGMPPFNNILSPEEIDALLQFIKHTTP